MRIQVDRAESGRAERGREARARARAGAVLCAWLGAGVAAAQGGALAPASAPSSAPAEPNAPAFIELELDREAVWAGQSFALRLRFGLETEFAERNLQQLFGQPLDVPVQLDAPWLDLERGGRLRLAAASAAASAPAARAAPRFALGESREPARVLGEQVRDGRRFDLYECERTAVVPQPGLLEFAAPRLRLAAATRFASDLQAEAAPLDLRVLEFEGAPRRLEVVPLPEEGRPTDFSGGVGSFTLHASLDVRDPRVRESFSLRVRVEGSGELAGVSAPRPTSLEGWHLLGQVEEREAGARVFRYELAAQRAGDQATPVFELPFFEPAPNAPGEPLAGTYRRARSAELRVWVKPAQETELAASAPASERKARERGSGWPAWSLGLVFVSAAAAWFVVRRRAR